MAAADQRIVWIFSWYTIYLEIFRWHHMTKSLRFNPPPPPPGTDTRPKAGVPDLRGAGRSHRWPSRRAGRSPAARARPGTGRAASSAARPGDGGGNRALCRRTGVLVPLTLAGGYRERSRECKDRAVPLEQPHVPARFAHLCGVPDRWVAGEAFQRAATAAASTGRGWPGIPVPALSRPGRRASVGRSRLPAHGRS